MVGGLRQSAATPDAAAIKTLGAGVIVMLSLLPMIRSASLIFGRSSSTIMVVTLILEASLSVVMLFAKMQCRRRRMERHFAETLTRAVRQGI